MDFGGGSVSTKEIHMFKGSTEDESENKTTITRNLPSGSNIYETLTTRIKVNKDGTTKKNCHYRTNGKHNNKKKRV